MPPVAVGNALRTQIPKDRSIPFDGIAAVYTFVYAVGIKVETSEIVVVWIGIDRVRTALNRRDQALSLKSYPRSIIAFVPPAFAL